MPCSEINGAPVDFPITETGRICTAASAKFFRHGGLGFGLPTFFRFLQRTLRSRRQDLRLCGLVLSRGAVIVVCVLHGQDHWKFIEKDDGSDHIFRTFPTFRKPLTIS